MARRFSARLQLNVAVLLRLYLQIKISSQANRFRNAIGLVARVGVRLRNGGSAKVGAKRSFIPLSLLSRWWRCRRFLSSFVAIAASALSAWSGMGPTAAPRSPAQASCSITTGRDRTAFSRGTVLQDAGHALGGFSQGCQRVALHVAPIRFGLSRGAARLLGVAVCDRCRLSRPIALSDPARTRIKVTRIAGNSCGKSPRVRCDSIAVGSRHPFSRNSFFRAGGANEAAIGGLFFVARIANALSHLAAAYLARKIGLLNTMVFTHMPSSVLLVTVALAPDFVTAAFLFVLREALVEMDVPTRQSYVMAVVREEERTFVRGDHW